MNKLFFVSTITSFLVGIILTSLVEIGLYKYQVGQLNFKRRMGNCVGIGEQTNSKNQVSAFSLMEAWEQFNNDSFRKKSDCAQFVEVDFNGEKMTYLEFLTRIYISFSQPLKIEPTIHKTGSYSK